MKNNKKNDLWTLKRIKRLPKRADGLKPYMVYAYTFRSLLECAASRYQNRLALSIWQDEASEVTYREMSYKCRNFGLFLISRGYRKGDKVLLMGESCPTWMIAYLGLTSVGLTAVPVLPEFSTKEVQNIIDESGVKGCIVNVKHFEQCYPGHEQLEFIRMEDLFLIKPEDLDGTRAGFQKAPGTSLTETKPEKGWEKVWQESAPDEEDLASLIFTSGTTGKSKGVMLTHKNLVWNIDVCCVNFFKTKPGMKALSILPMSHVYEFTTQQMLGMLCGFSIFYLGKPPAPTILMKAMQDIRPNVIMTVPLLIEKVYQSSVGPVLKNPKLKFWLHWKPSRHFICRAAGRKIKLAMGGKIKFFGIGGSALDPTVERFLYDAKFPYAQGYGLTETSPMIAGHGPYPKCHHLGFLGPVLEHETVRIDHPNKEGVGEILVKGPNVCKGYFHNDALTRESFTPDGFFRTGDLGVIKRGRLGLRGRTKTMILGSGGENIYPEAIESMINNIPFVSESLVIAEDGGLLALIKLDMESYAQSMQISLDEAKVSARKYLEGLKKTVNKDLSSFSKISDVELQEKPFERTPTMKIKRFLYERTGKKKDDQRK